jgi:hypothetical protein
MKTGCDQHARGDMTCKALRHAKTGEMMDKTRQVVDAQTSRQCVGMYVLCMRVCGYVFVLLFLWSGTVSGWIYFGFVLRVANRANKCSFGSVRVCVSLYL